MESDIKMLQMVARSDIINGDSLTDDEEIINKSIADTMEVLGHDRQKVEEYLNEERS